MVDFANKSNEKSRVPSQDPTRILHCSQYAALLSSALRLDSFRFIITVKKEGGIETLFFNFNAVLS
jgi:hypothetical protein